MSRAYKTVVSVFLLATICLAAIHTQQTFDDLRSLQLVGNYSVTFTRKSVTPTKLLITEDNAEMMRLTVEDCNTYTFTLRKQSNRLHFSDLSAAEVWGCEMNNGKNYVNEFRRVANIVVVQLSPNSTEIRVADEGGRVTLIGRTYEEPIQLPQESSLVGEYTFTFLQSELMQAKITIPYDNNQFIEFMLQGGCNDYRKRLKKDDVGSYSFLNYYYSLPLSKSLGCASDYDYLGKLSEVAKMTFNEENNLYTLVNRNGEVIITAQKYRVLGNYSVTFTRKSVTPTKLLITEDNAEMMRLTVEDCNTYTFTLRKQSNRLHFSDLSAAEVWGCEMNNGKNYVNEFRRVANIVVVQLSPNSTEIRVADEGGRVTLIGRTYEEPIQLPQESSLVGEYTFTFLQSELMQAKITIPYDNNQFIEFMLQGGCNDYRKRLKKDDVGSYSFLNYYYSLPLSKSLGCASDYDYLGKLSEVAKMTFNEENNLYTLVNRNGEVIITAQKYRVLGNYSVTFTRKSVTPTKLLITEDNAEMMRLTVEDCNTYTFTLRKQSNRLHFSDLSAAEVWGCEMNNGKNYVNEFRRVANIVVVQLSPNSTEIRVADEGGRVTLIGRTYEEPIQLPQESSLVGEYTFTFLQSELMQAKITIPYDNNQFIEFMLQGGCNDYRKRLKKDDVGSYSFLNYYYSLPLSKSLGCASDYDYLGKLSEVAKMTFNEENNLYTLVNRNGEVIITAQKYRVLGNYSVTFTRKSVTPTKLLITEDNAEMMRLTVEDCNTYTFTLRKQSNRLHFSDLSAAEVWGCEMNNGKNYVNEFRRVANIVVVQLSPNSTEIRVADEGGRVTLIGRTYEEPIQLPQESSLVGEYTFTFLQSELMQAKITIPYDNNQFIEFMLQGGCNDYRKRLKKDDVGSYSFLNYYYSLPLSKSLGCASDYDYLGKLSEVAKMTFNEENNLYTLVNRNGEVIITAQKYRVLGNYSVTFTRKSVTPTKLLITEDNAEMMRLTVEDCNTYTFTLRKQSNRLHFSDLSAAEVWGCEMNNGKNYVNEFRRVANIVVVQLSPNSTEIRVADEGGRVTLIGRTYEEPIQLPQESSLVGEYTFTFLQSELMQAKITIPYDNNQFIEFMLQGGCNDYRKRLKKDDVGSYSFLNYYYSLPLSKSLGCASDYDYLGKLSEVAKMTFNEENNLYTLVNRNGEVIITAQKYRVLGNYSVTFTRKSVTPTKLLITEDNAEMMRLTVEDCNTYTFTLRKQSNRLHFSDLSAAEVWGCEMNNGKNYVNEFRRVANIVVVQLSPNSTEIRVADEGGRVTLIGRTYEEPIQLPQESSLVGEYTFTFLQSELMQAKITIPYDNNQFIEFMLQGGCNDYRKRLKKDDVGSYSFLNYYYSLPLSKSLGCASDYDYLGKLSEVAKMTFNEENNLYTLVNRNGEVIITAQKYRVLGNYSVTFTRKSVTPTKLLITEDNAEMMRLTVKDCNTYTFTLRKQSNRLHFSDLSQQQSWICEISNGKNYANEFMRAAMITVVQSSPDQIQLQVTDEGGRVTLIGRTYEEPIQLPQESSLVGEYTLTFLQSDLQPKAITIPHDNNKFIEFMLSGECNKYRLVMKKGDAGRYSFMNFYISSPVKMSLECSTIQIYIYHLFSISKMSFDSDRNEFVLENRKGDIFITAKPIGKAPAEQNGL